MKSQNILKGLIIIGVISFSCSRSTTKMDSSFRQPTVESDAVKPKTAVDFADQEAKELANDGWKAVPGYGGMQSILRTVTVARQELNDKGNHAKYVGQGQSTGRGAMAHRNASFQAAANVLSQVQTYIEQAAAESNTQKLYPYLEGESDGMDKMVNSLKASVRNYINGAREIGIIYQDAGSGNITASAFRIYSIEGLSDEIVKAATEAAHDEQVDEIEAWADAVAGSTSSKLQEAARNGFGARRN